MAKGKKQELAEVKETENELQGIAAKLPQGISVVHKINDGLLLCKVDVKLLLEQDKNAHLMKSEMFRQLSENIKNRGALESVPFCALTEKGIEIVSGHHRVRASKEAELKEILILLDITNMSKSKIVAKQIAHNALNGFDDPTIMKELVNMINDVDDLIESYIGQEVLDIPDEEIEKLLSPKVNFDWKEIGLVFLPHQLRDLDLFINNANRQKDFLGAVPLQEYEKTITTISKYQKFANILNIGAAVHRLIEIANETMDKAGFETGEEWISLSKVFGNVAVPVEDAINLADTVKHMIDNGEIDKSRKWEALRILVKSYMNNGTKD